MVIPVDAVKSIDEMTCKLDVNQRKCPEDVGRLIKARLHDLVGPWIKCSLGYAANRHLAKMACKAGKPNGNRVWHPKDMPTPLLDIPLRMCLALATVCLSGFGRRRYGIWRPC
jgi:DNA polymerase IV